MCKCASSSGTDVSLKPMAEGSTLKLAQACKKYLHKFLSLKYHISAGVLKT